MLEAILNKYWKQQPSKQQLYGHLPPISKTIQVKPKRHMGHCKEKLICGVLLWTPTHGHASVGQPLRTYLRQLCVDTRSNLEDLLGVMNDRDG